ncbi:DedA family protein [Nocardia heshunensis]
MSTTPLTIASGGFGPLETAGPVLVWTIVLTFVFLECALIIGLFLPGDSMLITAGVVLASQVGEGQVWALSVGTMIAAIAGNQVGYVFGQRTGHHIVARKNGKYINTRNLARVSGMLHKHGFLAVLVARWIPWVRTLCPLVAGAAGMDHRKYTIASTIGAIIWAPVILLASYYAGSFLTDMSWLMPAVIGTLIVGLILGTVLGVRQYRAEMARPAEDFDLDAADAATVPIPVIRRQ